MIEAANDDYSTFSSPNSQSARLNKSAAQTLNEKWKRSKFVQPNFVDPSRLNGGFARLGLGFYGLGWQFRENECGHQDRECSSEAHGESSRYRRLKRTDDD